MIKQKIVRTYAPKYVGGVSELKHVLYEGYKVVSVIKLIEGINEYIVEKDIDEEE